jgi:hypothetical protein
MMIGKSDKELQHHVYKGFAKSAVKRGQLPVLDHRGEALVTLIICKGADRRQWSLGARLELIPSKRAAVLC